MLKDYKMDKSDNLLKIWKKTKRSGHFKREKLKEVKRMIQVTKSNMNLNIFISIFQYFYE